MGLNILLNIDHILINWALDMYALAGDVYDFILTIVEQEYMEYDYIKLFTDNIMVFVGILMLFRLGIALIEYLADPDKIDDKQVGTSKLIINILVTVVMLIASNTVFGLLRSLQSAILHDQIIEQVFSVNIIDKEAKSETVNNGFKCSYSSSTYTSLVNINITAAFVNNMSGIKIRKLRSTDTVAIDSKPIADWTYDNKKSVLTRSTTGKKVAQPSNVYYVPSDNGSSSIEDLGVNGCPKYAYKGYLNQLFLGDDAMVLADVTDVEQKDLGTLQKEEAMSYVNSTGRNLAGLLFFNYVSCDTGVNSTGDNGKTTCSMYDTYKSRNDFESMTNLLNLRLDLTDEGKNASGHDQDAIVGNGWITIIFGIVLLLYLITMTIDVAVRSLKLTVLQLLSPIPILSYATPKTKNVFDSWIKTIGSVYADLFIRILVISLISFIASATFATIEGQGFVTVALVLGLLMFMKEAPQFICNMLGIKDTGSLKGFTLNPFQKLREMPVVGGAMGMVGGMVGGAISGAQTGGAAGAFMGAAAGGRAGFANAGGLMGQDAGKRPQNGSGAVGGKAGQTFMQGKGGFMSRNIGARAARSYVGNERYADDENAARTRAVEAANTRSRNQAILDVERANLGVREAEVRRSQMGVDAARTRYEANPTDSINMSRLASAEAALAYSVAAYERTSIAYQTAQDRYDVSRSADERAQADLAEAERVRKRAQSVVEDAPRTARDVRHR